MVSVQQWAEVRRLKFVEGLGIREIRRRTGLHRETIRRALRSPAPPRYERASKGSKLDPFKSEIHRLLRDDAQIPGQRMRELIEPLGFAGGKTIVDDYLREVRLLFVDQRTYQRTEYRPGDVVQFDLWQPRREIPVGYGQTRKGYVVVGALGYSRVGAGALVFSKQAETCCGGCRAACGGSAGCHSAWSSIVRAACTPAVAGRATGSPRSAGS